MEASISSMEAFTEAFTEASMEASMGAVEASTEAFMNFRTRNKQCNRPVVEGKITSYELLRVKLEGKRDDKHENKTNKTSIYFEVFEG